MTFLKTLLFTVCVTILFGLLLANSLGPLPSFLMFMILLLVGVSLYTLFRKEPAQEIITKISIIYISSSIVFIIIGFTTNFAHMMTQLIKQISPQQFTIMGFFGEQNILLTLILLFVGLYGPTYYFKRKENLSLKQIFYSLGSVLLIYIIAFTIYAIIESKLIARMP